jgi:hypothetical protein
LSEEREKAPVRKAFAVTTIYPSVRFLLLAESGMLSLITMTTSIRPMTADELSRMPEDGFRHELVRGELKRIAPAVTVYRSLSDIVVLTSHDILDGGDVVPEWKLPLNDLFA